LILHSSDSEYGSLSRFCDKTMNILVP
jgi:hypothetical protein